MTIPPDHECVDHAARRTITSVQGELADHKADVFAGFEDLQARIDHVRKFLGAPPYVRQRRGTNGSTLESLVEEVTGSHNLPSAHPVRAMLERWVGKQALRVLGLAGIGVLGWTGHWVWGLIWAALKGH